MRVNLTFCALVMALCCTLPTHAQRIGLQLAQSHLQQTTQKSKFSPNDLKEPLVTDHYTSNGITHIYFRQTFNGIEIEGANAAVHIANGNVLTSTNQFLAGLEKRSVQSTAQLSAIDAIIKLSEQKGYPLNRAELKTMQEADRSAKKATVISAPSIAHNEIPARLVYVADANGNLNLAWNVAIDEVRGEDYMNYFVDAKSGKIQKEISWTTHCNFGDGHAHTHTHNENCTSHKHHDFAEELNTLVAPNSYNVFPVPVESPNFGVRSIVTEPWLANAIASPDAWHTIGTNDFTTTHGNNVDSYMDDDNTNSPTGGDAARADGGATLDFDFPLDLSGNPADFQDAAVTNLFYWGNITHDVWYNYGFDEASGNFQEDNFGRGGSQGDGVNMEAQDGSGTCNANMSTPPDGSNPRCQMYLCNGRDGDYDNGVVVHEYGHGISIRLTGGPATSGCLNNQEQMGEGWSDYFGTVMTIEPGDQGTDARPMGTYLFGQGPNGGGIRPHPYSTDFNINPMTYATVASGVSVPHGVGSVWATMLWEMTWALIDQYGWDPDLYNGTGGNNIAMQLVIEGLKLQPCSPGFVDGRDAILAADQALYNGANSCLIWEAFAARGLGFSANQGSSGSVSDGIEAFDLPPSCSIGLEKTANVTQVTPGGNITYTLSATNNTGSTLNNVVISDDLPTNTTWVSGGSLSGNTVSFPAVSLANNATHTVSFTVQVDGNISGNIPDFSDNMEGGAGNWTTNNTGASSWGLQSGTANSGSTAWFAADVGTTSVANLVLASAQGLTSSSILTFVHNYNTEATWDGGVVEISTDGGTTWADLGNDMTANGYNSTINNSRPAFSGNSGGFITTTVNLSAYAGQSALIRFQMNCDVTVSGLGWYVDDVSVNNLALFIPNVAQVTDGNIISEGALANPTLVTGGGTGPLGVSTSSTNISCNGANDGTASAIGTGGTGNYNYAWSNGSTTSTINGLAAGTYTVTVNDGTSTVTGSVTINEPTALTVTTTANPANNGNNGTASATAAGGTGTYTYAWSNGGNTATITGLAPGIYDVTATDANSCTVTGSVEVLDNNVPSYCNTQGTNQNWEYIEAVAVNTINNTSGDDGGYGDYTTLSTDLEQGSTINVTLTPGFTGEPYNEVWRVWIDYNQDLDFDDAGEEVLAPAGSTAAITTTFDVPANAPLGSTRMRISMKYNQAPPNCGDFTDGEAEDYTVNIVAPQTTPITLVMSGTDLSCNGIGDGTASVSASGGTGSYTYAWSNGGTAATINNLAAGTYTVTVSDGSSTETASVTINEPTAISLSTTSSDVTCNGASDGSAAASATGGTGTITYAWSNGGTTATISGLGAGSYTVTASDENGCLAQETVVITEPNVLTAAATGTDASCNGANDGSATASASGGTSPYTYAWSNGGTTATISGLGAGSYTVDVTDSNGCVTQETVVINEPTAIIVTVTGTDASCNGAGDGTATASASGGTSPYTYSWSNGDMGMTTSNLQPGAYSVVVTDANGCTATAFVSIGQPSSISISITSVNASCGADDGSASASANGGAGGFTYLWSNGATTASINGLGAGTYTVTATDTNGCSTSETVTISSPSGLSVTASSTDASCNGLADGSAMALVSGGNGGLTYSWNGQSGGATLSSIPAGTYTIVVTDAAGCNATATTTVSEPAALIITMSSTDANNGNNGTATATVSGGIAPYVYQWSNGGTTATIANLAGGTYTVTAIDANGCVTTGSVLVEDNNPTGNYCASSGNSTFYEWIEAIAVDGVPNTSGNDNGYGDYTSTFYELEEGGQHGVSLTPGFSSSSYNENWKIWIDFNQDGDFEDAGEEVFSGSSNTTLNGTLAIPSGVSYGETRMRISMQWGGTPTPCGTFSFGEVEDYTVDIVEATTGGPCTYTTINSENFEGGWGIWNDGGSDCRRSANDAPYANSGTYCARLRDNTNTSVMTTDVLNLAAYEEITVDFSYYARSMDNSNEDFWLQISTDGGAFVTVEEWNRGDEFNNNERKFDAVVLAGPFSSNTRLRFRCDASGNSDWVYIDDVVISGCASSSALLANGPAYDERQLKIGNSVEERDEIDLDEEDYRLDLPNELKLFPNPTSDLVTIAYQLTAETEATMLITDFTGRVIRQINTPTGAHQERLEVSNWTPGYYFVHIVAGEVKLSDKFVVVR